MKNIIMTCMALFLSSMAFSQAKKPTIMVVPSLTWCNEHGYTKTLETNGGTTTVQDFERAFLNDGDMKIAITTIGSMMSDLGFPLKDLEQNLSALATSRAENVAATSHSGADVAQSPLDIINARAKSDIIFDLYWKVNLRGPRRTLTYNLSAKDAYTSKQIAAATGTSEPSVSSELAILLQEAVTASMGKVEEQLMKYFEDMEQNGREVFLVVRTWDDSPYDLESEFEGQELNELIEDWMGQNTVKGVYSTLNATENIMEFEQVRIPLYGESGRQQDTRQWARGLVNFLKTKGIVSKLNMRGLGHATITIGGK